MEITLTFAPNYFLFGLDWYGKDEIYNWNEINLYFAFIELKITWE